MQQNIGLLRERQLQSSEVSLLNPATARLLVCLAIRRDISLELLPKAQFLKQTSDEEKTVVIKALVSGRTASFCRTSDSATEGQISTS